MDPKVMDPKIMAPKVVGPKIMDPKIMDPKIMDQGCIALTGVRQLNCVLAQGARRADRTLSLLKEDCRQMS